MFYKKMGKKGISPVVATVILIAMVIVIALIIFLWFRSMTKEAIVKFDENVELVCEDVSFRASYSVEKLQIVNDGTVPIYEFKIKKIKAGRYDTFDLGELLGCENWNGLNQGGAFSCDTSIEADEILVIPVLLGGSESGEKTFVCDERHGVEISLA